MLFGILPPPPSADIGRSVSSPSPLRKGRGEAEGQCGRRARAAAVVG